MTKSDTTIWILIDSRSFGGIETHVFELATGLKNALVSIKVVFLNDYGLHPLKSKLSSQQIPYEHVNGGIKHLLKKIHHEKPSVIHTHGYKAGIFGRLAGYWCRTPVISSFHAGEPSHGKLKLYDALDRYSAFLASKVVSVSDKISQKIPCRSEVVNNFVNTDHFERSKGNQIAFVGRLSPEKGADYFIQIAKQFPEHRFHIYGDGPLMNELVENASPNVVFHGQQNTMEKIWPNIGLLLITSRHEGLPMAALEAMGRGIPIISSNVGRMSNLIEQGVNGWLYPCGNVSILTRLLSDWFAMHPDLKASIQERSQYKVNAEFSSNYVIPKFIDMYQKITFEKGPIHE